MSVINKMLRDLDSRQSASASPEPFRPLPPGFAQGTVLVAPLKQLARPGAGVRLAWLMLAATLLAAGVALVWWSQYPKASPVQVASQKIVPVAMNRPAVAVVAPVMAQPAPAVVARLAPALKTLPTSPTPSPSPKSDTPSPRVSPAARPSPALDALAQAQSLWAAGSRAAALELLREALAVSERSNVIGSPSPTTAVLASLARELARMEMAEGHVSQALALLTRLEPSLSGEAEVWAMRGNAAQRLGRHEESAQAYQRALRLRPNEARWMLGAAVSLAAMGQTEPAAEFAEKARVGGVLSPEVATYLKQLGVSLR